MSDNTYRIIIETQGGTAKKSEPKATQEKEQKGFEPDIAIKGALVLSTAKRALSFAVNSIGMYTGNTVAQTQVTEAMGATATALAFVKSPITTAVMVATSMATSALTRTNEAMWENRRAERLARRSGNYLSTTTR